MTRGKKSNLLIYTWPIFIEYILQLLVSNIDKIMVNSISDTAVSSISNATTVLDVLLITFSVISLAITILASQYLGKRDYKKISEVYSLGLVVSAVLAFGVSILLLIFGKNIFELINVPSECMEGSLTYLNIISIGLVFQGVYSAFVAIFRTQGWMKQSMIISALVNIINTIGNMILIYGVGFIPSLGIKGAAISSVISRIIGLLMLIYIFVKNSEIKIDFKSLKPWPKDLFKKMMYIGLPSGGESISYNASQMMILMVVNSFGNAIIKLRSFANMFAMCSYMFASSLSQAAQIIVGFIIGEKDYDNADKEVKKCLVISVIISFIASLVLYIFSDFIFGIFIDDKYILSLAKSIMFIEIFLESARAVNMTLVRCLQATGDTIYPTIIGILSMWGVATLLSYVFGIVFDMGIIGVWIAMALDEIIRAFIFIYRWHKGLWRNKSII